MTNDVTNSGCHKNANSCPKQSLFVYNVDLFEGFGNCARDAGPNQARDFFAVEQEDERGPNFTLKERQKRLAAAVGMNFPCCARMIDWAGSKSGWAAAISKSGLPNSIVIRSIQRVDRAHSAEVRLQHTHCSSPAATRRESTLLDKFAHLDGISLTDSNKLASELPTISPACPGGDIFSLNAFNYRSSFLLRARMMRRVAGSIASRIDHRAPAVPDEYLPDSIAGA
jgi:hypothetical protein